MTRLSASGSRSHHRWGRSTGRWLVWMPAVMVGALFYWAVALGMGGLSLVAVSALSGAGGATTESAAADPTEDTAGTAEPASDDDDGDQPVGTLESGATDEAVNEGVDEAVNGAIVVRLQNDADDVDDIDDVGAGVADDHDPGARPALEPTAVEPMSGI